jgi:dihydropteroate synthase
MSSASVLDCGGKPLDLSRPRVMGILNVTPDSFSDGGEYFAADAALQQARNMLAEGADIIDVGGESTRPGSCAVTVDEEIRRVVPIIGALAEELPVPLSIDTSKPEVMRAAAAAGAGLINDVMALREPGALAAAAATGLPVCLMHMQGRPRYMQQNPLYADVVEDISRFFRQRIDACEAQGIARQKLVIDPGFGFGKTLEHNLSLLKHLGELRQLGLPILVGMSRKSMIGALTGRPVQQRMLGSVAAAVLAVQAGARIIRVHDVAATVDALKVAHAVLTRP